ncbi:hypothetical protein VdG1_03749 [Verticillium dahliae VDG1]|nr:hypothetical protein VdG1_03749 [Verticillium dahliae VDG1]
MEEERLWKFRKPEWLNSAWSRNAGVYAAGGLFSLAFYVMLDSAVWSKTLNGSDTHVTFARVVLFLGFAALAGGMAGGVTVFVLKFVVRGVAMPALSMGVENVVANALVMLSSVVLWVSQNMEDEYSYNLSL